MDVNAMNKSLKRLNSSIATVVVKNGGGYITYQDINPIDELLLECDGVHLSQAGNEIFLNPFLQPLLKKGDICLTKTLLVYKFVM